MEGWMDGLMNEWMNECMNEWMNEWMVSETYWMCTRVVECKIIHLGACRVMEERNKLLGPKIKYQEEEYKG